MGDVERATVALNAKKYDEAIVHLTNAIKNATAPNSVYVLHIQRATAYLHTKAYTKSLSDAIQAVETNPKGAEGFLLLGRLYYSLGDHERAVKYYQGATNNTTSQPIQTQVQAALKNITAEYGDVREFVVRGKSLLANGDFKGAHDSFSAAINIKPKMWFYYYCRALCYLGLKQEKPARQDALKLAELNPDWTKAEATRSGYLQKEGEVNMVRQNRVFYLKSYFLYYYDEKSPEKPKGVIVCYNIQCAKRDGGKLFVLETKDRQYFLKAANATDGMEWLDAVNQTRKKNIALPILSEPDEQILKAGGKRPVSGSLSSFDDISNGSSTPTINDPYAMNARPASFHALPTLPSQAPQALKTSSESISVSAFGNQTNRLTNSSTSASSNGAISGVGSINFSVLGNDSAAPRSSSALYGDSLSAEPPQGRDVKRQSLSISSESVGMPIMNKQPSTGSIPVLSGSYGAQPIYPATNNSVGNYDSYSAPKQRESSRDGAADDYFKKYNAPVPTSVSVPKSEERTPLLSNSSVSSGSMGSVPGSTAHHRRVVGIKKEEGDSEGGCCSCTVM